MQVKKLDHINEGNKYRKVMFLLGISQFVGIIYIVMEAGKVPNL